MPRWVLGTDIPDRRCLAYFCQILARNSIRDEASDDGKDVRCRGRLADASASWETPSAMTPAALDALLQVALPPLVLALRIRYLELRRRDPAAAVVAGEELATVERIRARLARDGWWN